MHNLCVLVEVVYSLQALHYKKYSTASDVWSFGCLMYETWSLGHKPFEGYTNSQVTHYYMPYLLISEMYNIMLCGSSVSQETFMFIVLLTSGQHLTT